VAATVAVGLAALRRGLATPLGLVTADPAFEALNLASPGDIVLGGHDVRTQSVLDTARAMHLGSGVFGDGLLDRVRGELAAFEAEIRGGYVAQNAGNLSVSSPGRTTGEQAASLQSVINRLAEDIRDFAARNRCRRVVVVNVASTEPMFELRAEHQTWRRLAAALGTTASKRGQHGGTGNKPSTRTPSPTEGGRYEPLLPASAIYALAAIEAGCPYVNFTPSTGVDIPAIIQHARRRGVPIMGRDGKTGETLLKSALAPMFRHRALRILSWDGHNILGNHDGAVLSDPAVKASKLRTKDGVVARALGYETDTTVSIQHVPSLDDWKIAWDHVHFQGFLGVKMSLQFTWQGCDSILAAPLVIDLARLAEFHARKGVGGVMSHLACFFKRPMGTDKAGLPQQIDMLDGYVAGHAGREAGAAARRPNRRGRRGRAAPISPRKGRRS